MVQAVRSSVVQVPHIADQQGGDLTLTKLIDNGVAVHEGDVLAQFDNTPQLKAAIEAEAKYDDLRHQVDQKVAEHLSNAEKRASDLQQAQADLAKAKLEIRKGPILSEIDREKNDVKLADATAHVASLEKSNAAHDAAEAAEGRVLELQRDRQNLLLGRLRDSANKLTVRAPFAGMVALENVWRNGTMGHAQEGDQLWPGTPLLRIFDPSAMEVQLAVNEPDAAALVPGTRAMVHLDAYPSQTFTSHYDSASPVASAGIGSPIRTFPARFRLEQSDPHLLPDLSAAVDIQLDAPR